MGGYRFSGRTARTFFFSGSLFLGAAAISGCKPDCDSRDERSSCGECDSMPEPRRREEIPRLACNRRIALDPATTCAPFVDPENKDVGWTGTRLYPGVDPDGTLSAYCRYEWNGEKEPDPTLLPLKSSEDCTLITPQSPEPFTQWAHDQFVTSVSTTSSALNATTTNRPKARAPTPGDGGVHTRVVVLDTSPDSNPLVDIEPGARSDHGETLAHLIRDIACQDPVTPGACSVQVKTQLVMPELFAQGVSTPAPLGGNAGRISDVSLGLWAEITAYRAELRDAALALPDTTRALAMPSRLVFNESFAFGNDRSGTKCDGTPAQSGHVDVLGLFDAFQAAACLGALHVAAAGNHTGGAAPSSGLMCPAHWDTAVAPSQAICEDLFGQVAFQEIKSHFEDVTEAKFGIQQALFEPISPSGALPSTDALVSVGAVDYGGTPIVLTRPDACPEVVALGVGAVGWDPTATSPVVPPFLFGTSVSAAVVSARLAAEWSQPASLAGFAPAIVAQGKASGRAIDFVTGGACTHLTSDLCSERRWIGSPVVTATNVQNPALGLINRVLTRRDPRRVSLYTAERGPVCGSSIPQCVSETASAASVAADYVWGQPLDPLCLKCGVLADAYTQSGYPELWIEPSGRFAATPGPLVGPGTSLIRDPVIVIEDATGTLVLTQVVDVAALTSSSTVILDRPGISLAGARAWLSVYDASGNSVSQQIFVNY